MKPLAVYVHIPFCTVKCGYCDFNAYAGMDAIKSRYGDACLREVELDAPLFDGRMVTSIGFGGGTPNEVAPEAIAAIISAVRAASPLAHDAEITLEANPGTSDAAAFRALHGAGVNRLSLGAQSFHNDELHFLDRVHSAEATVAAVRLARAAGFRNVGLDLIYGLPGQSPGRWQETLARAISLEPQHVSCYALTVEEGTMLARRVERGELAMPDEDRLGELYDLASERLEAAGYEQYELSNWARPGYESRHNTTYWTDGDYLAIGAGAHGYIAGERFENIAHPRAYIAAVEEGGGPFPALAGRYVPGGATAMSDWLALRLRLLAGFSPDEFERRFGRSLFDAAGPVLRECAEAGVLELAPRVRLTARGRLLHGEVGARILAHLTGREALVVP